MALKYLAACDRLTTHEIVVNAYGAFFTGYSDVFTITRDCEISGCHFTSAIVISELDNLVVFQSEEFQFAIMSQSNKISSVWSKLDLDNVVMHKLQLGFKRESGCVPYADCICIATDVSDHFTIL